MPVWQSNFSVLNEETTNKTFYADAFAAAQPERQRGLWNFLTWSFFLASFLTATDAAGGAARPAPIAADPQNSSHGDDSFSPFHRSHPGIQGAALESSPISPQLPESTPRLATNFIDPAVLPAAGAVPFADEGRSHTSPLSSSASVTALNSVEAFDNNDEATSPDGHTGPDANPGIIPELGLAPDIDHTLGIVTHTIGDLVGGALHTVGDVVTMLDNTIDTSLHAVATTLAATTGLVTNLLDTVETAIAMTDHAPATADAVIGSSSLLQTTLEGLGLASSGSLTFAADTLNDLAADMSAPPGGYSQFHISVHDAATSDAPSLPSDTGSITSIVTMALGIGDHHPAPGASSADHPGDHPSPHILQVHDLTSDIHHALFA